MINMIDHLFTSNDVVILVDSLQPIGSLPGRGQAGGRGTDREDRNANN
jgi:hypothetical protein